MLRGGGRGAGAGHGAEMEALMIHLVWVLFFTYTSTIFTRLYERVLLQRMVTAVLKESKAISTVARMLMTPQKVPLEMWR